MTTVTIRFDDDVRGYRPGTTLRGTIAWDGAQTVDEIELRLVWHTEGKGDSDLRVVRRVRYPTAGPRGEQVFVVELPTRPYSFSGKLISLFWIVEAIARPGGASAEREFVLSNDGTEVRLGRVE